MKVESDTTITVTLTPGELQQAILDWVRRNYRGDEAPHLVIQGVDFQFDEEGEYEDRRTKTDEWPVGITLVYRAPRPPPGV